MTILTEKIPGYNNTLTIATKSVKFGKNPGLNFSTDDDEGDPADDEDDTDEGDPQSDDDYADTADEDDDNDDDDTEVRKEPKAPENRRLAQLPKLSPKEPKRLDYVAGNKNNKDLIAVFSAMSVIGALVSFVFRLLVS